jgi:hypothetical protein
MELVDGLNLAEFLQQSLQFMNGESEEELEKEVFEGKS